MAVSAIRCKDFLKTYSIIVWRSIIKKGHITQTV